MLWVIRALWVLHLWREPDAIRLALHWRIVLFVETSIYASMDITRRSIVPVENTMIQLPSLV